MSVGQTLSAGENWDAPTEGFQTPQVCWNEQGSSEHSATKLKIRTLHAFSADVSVPWNSRRGGAGDPLVDDRAPGFSRTRQSPHAREVLQQVVARFVVLWIGQCM